MSQVGSLTGDDVTADGVQSNLDRRLFHRSPVALARTTFDPQRGLVVAEANAAFASLLRIPSEQLVGRGLNRFRHPEDNDPLISPTLLDDPHPTIHRRERRLRRADGTDVWVALSAALLVDDPLLRSSAGFVVAVEDITAQRSAQDDLAARVLEDPLTGLPNRTALRDRIDIAMARLHRSPTFIGILTVDVDNFLTVNDGYGYRVGDAALRAVGHLISTVVRPPDTVAHSTGDVFVVVVEGLPVPGDAIRIAERLRASFATPMAVEDHELPLRVSIGVSVTDDPGVSADTLLRRSELALDAAKDAGRDRVVMFEGGQEIGSTHHLTAVEAVRTALREDRVLAYYQPVVSLTDGALVGCEALVRIRLTDGQILSPASFIEAAEQSGLVYAVDERVLGLALAQQSQWRAAGRRLRMSVNVSPRRLAVPGFADHVAALLGVHDVDPDDLCLEVTENTVVDLEGPTLGAITALRETGVHVAIDDFGTGWAGLTSLRRLDADLVKIDRSFIRGLGVESQDTAIVAGVIAMAHRLNRKVVAEGVETIDQAARLRDLGCDLAQGFLVSRPIDSEAFAENADAFAVTLTSL